MVRGKNRLRKAGRFQYAFVHLPITRTVSGLSTSHIDRDLTTCVSRRRVEVYGSAFDLEASMHGVQESPQSKSNGRLRGVGFDFDRSGRKRRILSRNCPETEADQQQGE